MTEKEIVDFLEDEINGLKEQKYGELGEIAAKVFKEINGDERIKVFRAAIQALEEIQQYRKIGTIEEIRKMINQGINNCYMSHKYEHPGYEEGMCAGLRTMNGDGEPVYKCKLCRLNYLFERSEGE